MLCLLPVPAQGQAAESTQKMAEHLRSIFAATDWRTDPNKTAQRARYYSGLLEQHGLSPRQSITVQLELANELLRSGDSVGSIRVLEGLRGQPELAEPDQRRLTSELALSYLRLGEQENCREMHGQHSCLFPVRGSGIHQKTTGAEGAIREFTHLLAMNPSDTGAIWLLNIAYAQLGRYPQDVPAQWLAPPEHFASAYDIGEFPDVAPQAGLDVTGHAGGALVEDIDGDGLLDVIFSSSGPRDQLRYFHNNGSGSFSERTLQAGLMGETGGLNLVAADYDNDGRIDVLILRGGWWGRAGQYPFSLLRNRKDGTFEDVTERAGLLSPHPTQTAAWADFDGDGWLDLYVGHESDSQDDFPSQLFRNNHDGTFTEVAAVDGVQLRAFVKGVAWGDYNNDGRPDLYISVMGGANHLFRNDGAGAGGRWKFTDATGQAGVAEPAGSFACWFFDYDNDGWPDIFVAGYTVRSEADIGAFALGRPYQAETPRLYHNQHDGTFADVTRKVGLDQAILVMGAGFGDLDNDGWLDLYLGTGDSLYTSLLPNRMFRNDRGRTFRDVTTSGGFGHLQKGHSVVFADIENTGSEDILEEMGGALPGDAYQSVVYQDPGHPGNHWLTLELEGVRANREAIGARIVITVRGPRGRRRIYRTAGFISSFGSSPARQHIGMGDAISVEDVEVRWPGSSAHPVQHLKGALPGHAYRLREGEPLKPLSLRAARISAVQGMSTMRMP